MNDYSMKRMGWSLVFGAILVAGSVQAGFAETKNLIEKSFEASPGGRLIIDSDLGAIEVRGGADNNNVGVAVRRTATARSEAREKEMLDDQVITMEKQGNDVVVRARRSSAQSGFWNFTNERLDVRFEVRVPEKFSADLKTSGGSILVEGLKGDAKARTAGGRVQLKSIEGTVEGRTAGGSVKLEGCKGPGRAETSGGGIELVRTEGVVMARTSGGSIHSTDCVGEQDLSTSGGSIRVERFKGPVNASTSGGSIDAELLNNPERECRLSTSGGSVTARVPDSAAVDVDAVTSGGRVTTELPVTVQGEQRRSSLKGKINGGGPLLKLRTSGGSIHLKKA